MSNRDKVLTALRTMSVPHLVVEFEKATHPRGNHRGWIDVGEMEQIIRAASPRGLEGMTQKEWRAILKISEYDHVGPKAKDYFSKVKARWMQRREAIQPIRPSFSALKNNYKTTRESVHTCSMEFPNTCAIRLSEALVRTNPKFLEKFKAGGKNVCPHGYVRGAQDLGAILASGSVWGTRNHGWNGVASGAVPAGAKGKKGVVCYMEIPGFSGQGHIDLWDGTHAVGDAYWNAKTIWMWTLS